MKNLIALSLVAAVLGFASLAHADRTQECGTLEVSQFDGQYDFVLDQGEGALELSASPRMSEKMSSYDGKHVCVDIVGTRDAYGDSGDRVVGFHPGG